MVSAKNNKSVSDWSIQVCARAVERAACLACEPVRVNGGMSLRNGMWHGLRNDIIMRNLIYAAE